jgi:phosphoribosyl 1,2-cyclic phosphodiesterase
MHPPSHLHVKFWGTRGSIPTPGPTTRRYGGNTPCIEIRSPTTTIIVDAGSGIRNLGQDLLRRASAASPVASQPTPLHLLLSHTHWDHIQGFPFFLPAYLPTTEVRIYDLNQQPERFYRLLSGQMQSEYFPIRFSDLRARITPATLSATQTLIGDVTVQAYPNLKHPGGSIAYAFQFGQSKVVYASDNEADLLRAGPAAPFPQEFLTFLQDTDLLIADAQYTDTEYPAKSGWGHTSLSTVVDLAAQARVQRLALFHHDPMRTDQAIDDMVAAATGRARQIRTPLVVFAAREGVTLGGPNPTAIPPGSRSGPQSAE